MLAAAVALGAPTARADDTLRCAAGLVQVGDPQSAVVARCGSPSLRDAEIETLPNGLGTAREVDVWTYNFGPRRLLYVLRFRTGRLRRIEAHGYGFQVPQREVCDPYEIVIGMTKYELISRCGPPETKTATSVLAPLGSPFPGGVVQRLPNGVYAAEGGYHRPVYRERWVYDFGAKYLKRDVTLENGYVTAVETGERGGH